MHTSRSILVILLISFLFGFLLWGGMLWLTFGDTLPNELLIEMGKIGASLSLLTVIGGGLQWILKERDIARQQVEKELDDERRALDKQRDIDRQKENEKLAFYRNILADLKSVYDRVEKARLLIEAHRTAKTYGEQMRELIGGVVTLHNIKRALDPEFQDLKKELKPHIDKMSRFIKDLLLEYRDNYKLISVLQGADEEEKKRIQAEALKGEEILEKDIPARAWRKIKALEILEILRDDSKYKEYEARFLVHLDKASVLLRKRIPVAKERLKPSG